MSDLNNLSTLLENDLEQARLIFAATDVAERLQKMAEDIAKMSVNDIMPIVDDMRGTFGPEKADAFENAVNEALDSALDSIKGAKDNIANEVMRLEGKDVPENDMAGNDMAGDEGEEADLGDMGSDEAPAPEADGEADIDAGGEGDDEAVELDDIFGGAEGASGEEEEPLGRAKKESAENTDKALVEADDTNNINAPSNHKKGSPMQTDAGKTKANKNKPKQTAKGSVKALKPTAKASGVLKKGAVSEQKAAMKAKIAEMSEKLTKLKGTK